MNNQRLFPILIFCVTYTLSLQAGRAQADRQKTTSSETSVGVSSTIQGLILPGTELEVKPLKHHDSPIVLRIKESYVHGSSFRYDIVYYGLEPGDFNLCDYLQRIDGSTTDDLPNVPVTIASVLPSGQTMPNQLESRAAPRVGGYRTLLVSGGIVWLAGLLLLIFWGRKNGRIVEQKATRPQTLAEQLRPLVESAIRGELPAAERAELEHLLLSYWQQKLDVGGLTPSQAIRKLKSDAVAGKLLLALEDWLHNPTSPNANDVTRLLEPYRDAEPLVAREPVT